MLCVTYDCQLAAGIVVQVIVSTTINQPAAAIMTKIDCTRYYNMESTCTAAIVGMLWSKFITIDK